MVYGAIRQVCIGRGILVLGTSIVGGRRALALYFLEQVVTWIRSLVQYSPEMIATLVPDMSWVFYLFCPNVTCSAILAYTPCFSNDLSLCSYFITHKRRQVGGRAIDERDRKQTKGCDYVRLVYKA